MTAPPEVGQPPSPDSGGEQRLHPLSFLFKFLSKAIGIPLAALTLVVLGGGDVEREIGGGMIVAVSFAVYSLISSRAFRYRLGGDELVVREGVFSRTERHIPYARVQNIVQRRSPLHRMFGVTELRLESAGGSRPEAIMAVITLEAARAIEDVLRDRATAAVPPDEAGEVLLAMSPADLVRLGLVRNRSWEAISAGMVLVASQVNPGSMVSRAALQRRGRALSGWTRTVADGVEGPAGQILLVLAVVLAGLLLLKLLSIAMAFVTFHRFQLRQRGGRLSTEGGLLERRVSSVRHQRIQRLSVAEPWLARLMGRRSLACAVDAGHDKEDDRLSWLVPLGTRSEVDRVLAEVAPGLSLERLPWLPLHPRAWRRRLTTRAAVAAPVAALGTWLLGPPGLAFGMAVLVVAALETRAWGRFAAYAVDGEVLAFRAGWRREWRVTWLTRGQTVRLNQSPLDRRHGMASVDLDTAGASEAAPGLHIPYLPEPEARALAAKLQRALGRREVAADR
jgi:putative membrane protein